MPLTAFTVTVPDSVAPEGLLPSATVTDDVAFVLLPYASLMTTVGAGLIELPAAAFDGWTPNASAAGMPEPTVNVALVPGRRSVSPAVAVTVRLTPDSAFVYVTPLITALPSPISKIVPLRTPPRTPVPVARLRLTSVSNGTGTALPPASSTWTVTSNGTPACGFEPWLIEVIPSWYAGPTSTVNGALVPAERLSPLVRVAVS